MDHKKGLNPDTKTGRIHIAVFQILKVSPDGVRWVELAKSVQEIEPQAHPKTINGCIWKLTQTFPDQITKTDDKLFRLR